MSDVVVLVDIHVVALANRGLPIPSVLVHIADTHVNDGPQPPHFPVGRHIAEPWKSGGLVGRVVHQGF